MTDEMGANTYSLPKAPERQTPGVPSLGLFTAAFPQHRDFRGTLRRHEKPSTWFETATCSWHCEQIADEDLRRSEAVKVIVSPVTSSDVLHASPSEPVPRASCTSCCSGVPCVGARKQRACTAVVQSKIYSPPESVVSYMVSCQSLAFGTRTKPRSPRIEHRWCHTKWEKTSRSRLHMEPGDLLFMKDACLVRITDQ